MYVTTRTIGTTIKKLAESFPCIVIYGVRQVGESTTINHIFGKEYQKVIIDDIENRELAIQSKAFWTTMNGYLL